MIRGAKIKELRKMEMKKRGKFCDSKINSTFFFDLSHDFWRR
jgi:hypothetical protein